MSRHHVLVVCGSGASSAFLVISMRKAIQERGLDITVKARSESEIENYADETDAVMIGPHLSLIFRTLKELYGDRFPVILMGQDYYGKLDGNLALDHLLRETGWE